MRPNDPGPIGADCALVGADALAALRRDRQVPRDRGEGERAQCVKGALCGSLSRVAHLLCLLWVHDAEFRKASESISPKVDSLINTMPSIRASRLLILEFAPLLCMNGTESARVGLVPEGAEQIHSTSASARVLETNDESGQHFA